MVQDAVRLQPDGRWPADVEVWHVVMPPFDAPVDTSLLDASERERAARYRLHADRVRYIVTRAALRELLANRLLTTPASVGLMVDRRGKPELTGSCRRLSFNVAHSGEHALIAISDSRIVGVDVERIDHDLNWRELAAFVCTEDELRRLDALSVRAQTAGFFRCWTAKEALLKALGLGMAGGLQTLDVGPTGVGPRRPVVVEQNGVREGAADLQYYWLPDIPDYVGCVAFGGLYEAETDSIECSCGHQCVG